MNARLFRFIVLLAVLQTPLSMAFAGDDASGHTLFTLDLSREFATYSMAPKDKQWSDALIKKFRYEGRVVHFVRTSLPLTIGDMTVQGSGYQGVEQSNVFYVVDGDAMLRSGTRWAYSPGVGGFSMHAPKSRNFIVCLNFGSGVPFLSSSPVTKGVVTWRGDQHRNRLR